MRIRFTRPEFYRSERVASVDWEVRYILKGLESYVDDNGVGRNTPALVAADVLPHDLARDASRTLARLHEAIIYLNQAGLLWLYEHEGTELMYIAFWEKVQRIDRPAKGRLPRPDGTLHYGDSEINAAPANNREPSRGFATKAGKQVSREAEKQVSIVQPQAVELDPPNPPRNNYPDDFEEFWTTYPRRESKKDAHTAFKAAKKRAPLEQIMQGAERYRDDPNREQQFTKLPATWLRADGWEDEPLPPRTDGRGPSRLQQNMQVARQMWEAEQQQARKEIEA